MVDKFFKMCHLLLDWRFCWPLQVCSLRGHRITIHITHMGLSRMVYHPEMVVSLLLMAIMVGRNRNLWTHPYLCFMMLGASHILVLSADHEAEICKNNPLNASKLAPQRTHVRFYQIQECSGLCYKFKEKYQCGAATVYKSQIYIVNHSHMFTQPHLLHV